MALQAGIVGLPNVGKSTLFNALTSAGVEAANYPFATIAPNVGVVSVPDGRLAQLASVIETRAVIPTTVEMVDIAGLVRGASTGEGLGNQFLGHIRAVDAVVEVVRCFEDPEITHVEGSIDPVRDMETVATELVLADLAVAERRLERLYRAAKSGDEELAAQSDVCRRMVDALAAGIPVRAQAWDRSEALARQEAEMLTARPILYVCNVDVAGLGGNEHTAAVAAYAGAEGAPWLVICARAEADIAELDAEDRAQFLADLGLAEPGLHALARAAYDVLDLRTFFTAGPTEIRARTLPAGATAVQAAGAVHSDFEAGFIRAEVYSVEDLVSYGNEAALRAAGKLRVEGRDYVIADGDVVHVRFNV